jgi:serine protease AprX
VSAAVKGSALANLLADRFIDGPGRRDYVAMSGTSMAAAVVSGAVALLLDGDAGLRPLHVKLALQGSADFDSQAGLIAAGAGSLNLDGLKNVPHLQHALQSEFGFSLGVPSNGDSVSQVIIWGEVIVWGEVIIWGESIIDATAQGRVIIWGESLLDVIIWGESTIAQDVIIWGENANVIIWGEGADVIIWGETTDVIIWGESSDVIIWGESRLQLSSVQTNHLTQFDVSV